MPDQPHGPGPTDPTPAHAAQRAGDALPVARPVSTPIFRADDQPLAPTAHPAIPPYPPAMARAVAADAPTPALLLPTLTRRQALLDVTLATFVCLLLPIAQSVALALAGVSAGTEQLSAAISLPVKCLEAATVCGVAAYFLLRHRLRPRSFGLRLRGLPAQLGWGAAALILVYLYLLATVFALIPFSAHLSQDLEKRVEMFRLFENQLDSPGSVALLLVPVVVHEELLFRGLLLPLLRRACGRWSVAVLLASGVFGALHLVQGVFGAVQIFGLSIVLSLCFIVSRSLLSVMLAHYVFDFVQIFVFARLLRDFHPAAS